MKTQPRISLSAVRTTARSLALAPTITLGSLALASAQPTITNQPQDQFVNAGESAALSI